MTDRNFDATNLADLPKAVYEIVADTPVTDMHTHVYAPDFGGLLLWGIDELLTYHYLVAEFFRVTDMAYGQFWKLDKKAQADAIWRALFIERSPISESCRGVLTVLHKLGLDTSARDLDDYRAWFAEQDARDFVDKVYQTANLKTAVMTNDPFDDTERPVWEKGWEGDPRFRAVLRIDPLLTNWDGIFTRLEAMGYEVVTALSNRSISEVRRFLSDWVEKMDALYMAVSLPPTFRYPEESVRARLIDECVLPVCREHGIPFAMMIGVKRGVNDALRLAGDGVGHADVGSVERLCAAHPENKFLVTMLARENQHALTVATRKFRNLLLFGCWWFLNNPSLIEEMTRMRFELLGTSVVPQHSDARVLDQVIYKWEHSRQIIARVLADKYADLAVTGWTLSEAEIRRDAERLLGGNFWEFLGKQP